MASVDTKHSLLFGLLALQNGLIDQGALFAAFAAWTRDKARSLADHLADLGHLDAPRRAVVEAIADLHVRVLGDDIEKSLAVLAVGPSTREGLAQAGGPDVESTLGYVGSAPGPTDADDDPDRTGSYSVGSATSDGQRFRIVRPHARGGLGAVFVALDSELDREVALKQILDDRADDPNSRFRFLIEAQITGGLEHPGIVPVYGLGTYEDGRPYYTMRFIRGESLKEAIHHFHEGSRAEPVPAGTTDSRDVELRKLLRRFMDVCNAIDYAHSRGVIHRDIKPANIIVGKHGETLIVDWGLAKPTGRVGPGTDPGERLLMPSPAGGSSETLPGSALGTPAYMSPEQAEGQLDRLGPRSDVYSLGATLYCLLTGVPPFAGEVADVIRAVQRGDFRAPRQLDPSLDPALEAICLRAMAHRPEDRYSSGRSLADDLDRWMADEPVTAWREPWARRALRWARRNRTAVTTAAVALVVGVMGLGAVAGVQAHANGKLRNANAATNQALMQTKEAQAETQSALKQSEESRKQAEAVSTFLVESFRSPDPSQDGRQVKVADILDRASQRLERGFEGSRVTEGALLNTLGRTYAGLGLYARSLTLHAKACALRETLLGPEHPDTLVSRDNLAAAYYMAGRRHEAIAMHEANLKWREGVLGPDHSATLNSRTSLALAYADAGRLTEAITMHEATLKVREAKLGPDHPATLHSRSSLGSAYQVAGRTSEAIALHEATLKRRQAVLGPDHPSTLDSRNNLAVALSDAGRTPEVIALHEGTLALREVKLGPDHPNTLDSRSNLATAYYQAGRISESIALHEATLKSREAVLGHDHPDSLDSRYNLAIAYWFTGRLPEAIALDESMLELREVKLGSDHYETLQARINLAIAYQDAGRVWDAVALYESTLPRMKAARGADHPDLLLLGANLASAYEALGRWADAEALLRDTLARRRKIEKPESPLTAGDLSNLGKYLVKRERWAEAEPLLREALAIFRKAIPDDWQGYEVMSLLGGSLLGQARHAEAEPLVVAGYEGINARKAAIPVPYRNFLLQAASRVVRLYEDWNKPDVAATWKAKLGMPDLPADIFARP